MYISDHMWALKKWPLGLCIEVKIDSKGAFGTQPSEVVSGYRWSLAQVSLYSLVLTNLQLCTASECVQLNLC